MKNSRVILSLMLVITMLFTVLALGSCKWLESLGQSNNPPHSHSFVEGKCQCGEIDPSYKPDDGKPDDGKPDDNKPGDGTDPVPEAN